MNVNIPIKKFHTFYIRTGSFSRSVDLMWYTVPLTTAITVYHTIYGSYQLETGKSRSGTK